MNLLDISGYVFMALLIWLTILACVTVTKIVLEEIHEMKNERKRRK